MDELQEQFDEKVELAVKESEHISEAMAEAVKHRHLVDMTDEEIEDYVSEAWNEIWSNYL